MYSALRYLLLSSALVACSSPMDSWGHPRDELRAVSSGAAVLLDGEGLLIDEPPAEHGGFMLGSPVGITRVGANDVLIHMAGFESELEPAEPSVDFSRILLDWLPAKWHLNPKNPSPILAMSLGIDIINVESSVESLDADDELDGDPAPGKKIAALTVPEGGWIAFEFVVDEEGLSGPGEPIAPDILLALGDGELESSIFNFLVPHSSVDPSPEDYETVRALTPQDLGIAKKSDIVALNMHMALYDTDLVGSGSSFFTRELPANPTLYFSWNPAFLGDPGNKAWLMGLNVDPLHLGTIMKSSWTGSSWSMPELHRQLPIHEPIDGLSIDIESSTFEEILFSTTEANEENQMEYLRFGGLGDLGRRPLVMLMEISGPVRKYRSAGKKFRARGSIGDFCTRDPLDSRQLGGGGGPALDDFVVGRRIPPQFPMGVPAGAVLNLSVSGYRFHGGAGGDGGPMMRTCMALRQRHSEVQGSARVEWGIIRNFMQNKTQLTSPMPDVDWIAWQDIPYEGSPLVADFPFPDDLGVDPWRHALVAQWSLYVGDKLHIGTASVLRLYIRGEKKPGLKVNLDPQVLPGGAVLK